jgi:hypothetical protein
MKLPNIGLIELTLTPDDKKSRASCCTAFEKKYLPPVRFYTDLTSVAAAEVYHNILNQCNYGCKSGYYISHCCPF